jgi:L,D-peptidoglycan transpeptidase YkuD (ErfK/YbiS/YcfS/YnhG family)
MRRLRKRQDSGTARAGSPITVFSSPRERHRGLLRYGTLAVPCALGRSGVTHLKREGDGATPAGRHRLLSLYVRRDRLPGPQSRVPMQAMRRDDGWCEDARDGRYNRPVRLPARAGHETLWRGDRLYDIVGVLDWNMRPRIRGLGSAIFLHLCRPGFGPTAGCIALRLPDLKRLLASVRPGSEISVAAKPRKAAAQRFRAPIVGGRKAF